MGRRESRERRKVEADKYERACSLSVYSLELNFVALREHRRPYVACLVS